MIDFGMLHGILFAGWGDVSVRMFVPVKLGHQNYYREAIAVTFVNVTGG